MESRIFNIVNQERFVSDFLINVSNKINSSDFAKESTLLLQNDEDINFLFAFLYQQKLNLEGVKDDENEKFQFCLMTLFIRLFSNHNIPIDYNLLPKVFKEDLSANEQNIIRNKKFRFALNQFVNAYLKMAQIEKSYPTLYKNL